MQKRLFVGNLSFDAKEEDLRKFFLEAGDVESVSIILDRRSGRPKGYAFVEMVNPDSVSKALQLNGREFMGRNLIVAEANPREVGGDRDRKRGGKPRWKKDRNRFSARPNERPGDSKPWWKKLLGLFGFGSNSKPRYESEKRFNRRPPQRRTKIRSIYE